MPLVTVKNRATGRKSEILVATMNSPLPEGYERVFVPACFSIGNTFQHLKQTPFKDHMKKLAYRIENEGGHWRSKFKKSKLKTILGI